MQNNCSCLQVAFAVHKYFRKSYHSVSALQNWKKAKSFWRIQQGNVSSLLNAEVVLHDGFISELPKDSKTDSSQIFQNFISAIFSLHSEDWVQTLSLCQECFKHLPGGLLFKAVGKRKMDENHCLWQKRSIQPVQAFLPGTPSKLLRFKGFGFLICTSWVLIIPIISICHED